MSYFSAAVLVANEPPSGRQFELRFGVQRAVAVEVGGGLREYMVDGRAVLDGYAIDQMADGGRGQPLLPWPNRIADGQYEFDAQSLQLPIEEVGRHNAIHGLVRWLNWTVAEQTDDRVRLGLFLHPRPGYPFSLDLSIEYALAETGLTVRITAVNRGQRPLPFAAGQHPYLTLDGRRVDSAVLRLPSDTRLELDAERRLPTGKRLAIANTPFDFRAPKPVGTLELDDCYASLQRDADGLARISLSDPDVDTTVTLWMDAHYRYVQVYSGDALAPERRRHGLAVEPMTCPPNAFRTSTDLIVLQPDQVFSFEWGLTPGTRRSK